MLAKKYIEYVIQVTSILNSIVFHIFSESSFPKSRMFKTTYQNIITKEEDIRTQRRILRGHAPGTSFSKRLWVVKFVKVNKKEYCLILFIYIFLAKKDYCQFQYYSFIYFLPNLVLKNSGQKAHYFSMITMLKYYIINNHQP